MNRRTIEIECKCGEKHRIDVDALGMLLRWAPRLPKKPRRTRSKP